MDNSFKNTAIYKGLSIILIVLEVFTLVLSIYSLTLSDVSWSYKGVSVLNIVALVGAVCYVIRGFKKEAAGLYKMFLVFYGLSMLLSVRNAANINYEGIPEGIITAVLTIAFACIFTLLFAPNLGKKLSFTFAIIGYIIVLLFFITSLVSNPGTLRGGIDLGTVTAINRGVMCLMQSVLILDIVAKYKDKTARGSK